MKIRSIIRGALMLVPALALMQLSASAQHTFNNAVSQYYRDGFLWNPAMAGAEGTRFYGLVNSAWAGFDGSSTQAGLSWDMKLSEHMGIGVNLASSSAAAFRRYAGAFSYAYDLTFNQNTGLRIGADLSLYKEHLDSKELVSGGQVDPVASSFNEKGVHFDGDLGAQLHSGGLNIGAVGYNLGRMFKNGDDRESDLQIAQLESSYRFALSNEKLSLTPLLAYKLFTRADDIFLVATQFAYDGIFHTSLYWESTGSVMGGLGFLVKDFGEVNFFYTSKNKYGYHEQYEVGLKIKLK
jgi:type IX secretion system PorP/SprF family membrane protein